MKDNLLETAQSGSIPDEEFYTDPKWESLRKTMDFIERQPRSRFLPPKYYEVQKMSAAEEIERLIIEQPDWSLKEALLFLLKDLPDYLPADRLLDLVAFCTRTWEECKTPAALEEVPA